MSTRENIVTTDRLGLKESTFLYGKTNVKDYNKKIILHFD